MSCSSSETFTVMDFRPCGESKLTHLNLTRGFKPGMVLHVIASTEVRSGFNVKDGSGNILLHVNPRFDENLFVFNTYKGCWGPEERVSSLPIHKNIQYHLHIVYHATGYRIFINGEEFYFYKHRITNEPTQFEIVQANIFYISYNLNTPKWCTQEPAGNIYVEEFGNCGKATPHEIQIEQCKSLSWIIITGIINCSAKRFDINFMNCSNEIVFHFNPRFTDNCVVLNSYLKRAWGKEERTGGVPFKPNEKFVLAIDVESNCYKMFVNGNEYATYNHRAPTSSITKIQIEKDIKIQKIIYRK